MSRAVVLLAALLSLGAAAPAAFAAQTHTWSFRDANVKDRAMPPGWDADDIGWAAHGGRLASAGAGRASAWPRNAPYCARAHVTATVRLTRAATAAWKLAGVALAQDDANYWQLALVEQPDDKGKRHFVELQEMLAGTWQANSAAKTKLTATAARGGDFSWEYDHDYQLRLAISPEGITGVVSEVDGTERAYFGYQFDGTAVRTGRFALVTSGMAAEFASVQMTARETAPPPKRPLPPPYVRSGMAPVTGTRTGRFHVQKIGQRWWVIDPAGAGYYVVGTDHVNYNVHFSEALGYAPYHRNVEARYGGETAWANSAIGRLKRWGFNTLGAGCGASTRHRGLAHTEFLSLGAEFTSVSDIAPRTTWTGFPDVFHPDFSRWCEMRARRIIKDGANDPWLLGYFIDNELEWYGKNGSPTGLVDEVMKKPWQHPAKQALYTFLRARYADVGAFNRAWGMHLSRWADLADVTPPVHPATPAGAADRTDFVKLIARKYFAITSAAIRKVDPRHMVLGCRFAGQAPPGVVAMAGRYCDIVTINYYGQIDLARGVSTDMPAKMRAWHAEAKRPLMITEWSFPALDAGLPSLHGAGQRVATQKERARCYRIYQEALFSMPFMVGSDYFMWADEPAQGISSTFPEDSNYGLVDVKDDAWPALTATAQRVNPLADALHSGRTAELSVAIEQTGPNRALVRVHNAGIRAAHCPLVLWRQGAKHVEPITLKPGATVIRTMPVGPGGLCEALVDPEERLPEMNRTDNRTAQVLLAKPVRSPIVVAQNTTDEDLHDVPVEVSLSGIGQNWTLRQHDGQPLPSEVDLRPGGATLAARLPSLPAHSAVVMPLVPGAPDMPATERGGDRNLDIDGTLQLRHHAGSGDFFDEVKLAGTLLGSFRTVIMQRGESKAWVSPARIESMSVRRGPVRTVVEMTAVGGGAGREFAATYRMTCWPGESWFAAEMVEVRNRGAQAWNLGAYYWYPLSNIDGSAAEDRPRTAADAPMWFNERAGLVYGAVVNRSQLNVSFWKDTPDGPGQHPDIWREVDRPILPGQALHPPAGTAPVLIFGSRDAQGLDGGPTAGRLRSLAAVKCWLRKPGR